MNTNGKILISFTAIVVAALMVGTAFYGPVGASTGQLIFPDIATASYNQTDNLSLETINELISHLNPNYNTTEVYMSASGLHNNSLGMSLTSSGELLLNDTYKYSYTLNSQHQVLTNGNSTISTLELTNSTSTETKDLTTTIYTTVTTTYYLTLNQTNNVIYGKNFTNTEYDTYHKVETQTVIYYGSPQRLPKVSTSTDLSNSVTFADYNYYTIQGITFISFKEGSPDFNSAGNLSVSYQYNETNVQNGNVVGNLTNSTGKYNFTISIDNNTGSISLSNDPANFTLDPTAGQSRNINGGTETVSVAWAILNANNAINAAQLAAVLYGALGFAAGLSGQVEFSAFFFVISIAAAWLSNYLPRVVTSQYTIDPYIEVGWWHPNAWWESWIIELYLEGGSYTNELHYEDGQVYWQGPMTFYPLAASNEGIVTLGNDGHSSIFPNWYPYV